MKAVDCFKLTIRVSQDTFESLINDLKETPLTFPTPNGGNHPLWIVGHLAYVEGQLVHRFIMGKKNPLHEWAPIFGIGSEPSDDASLYPSLDETMAKYQELRSETWALIETLTDDDLDKPAHRIPEDLQPMFGTIGKCLAMVGLHTSNHCGQLTDVRRALSKKPIRL